MQGLLWLALLNKQALQINSTAENEILKEEWNRTEKDELTFLEMNIDRLRKDSFKISKWFHHYLQFLAKKNIFK